MIPLDIATPPARGTQHARAAGGLALVLIALAGCRDGFAGPHGTGVAGDPAHLGLWVSNAASGIDMTASAPPQTVQTSGGTHHAVHIPRIGQEVIVDFGDATAMAIGVATFADPHAPSSRYIYHFRTGRTACEGGLPVAYLEGEVKPAGGDEAATPFLIAIYPYIEQGLLFRIAEGPERSPGAIASSFERFEWVWLLGDAVGRAGEAFIAEGELFRTDPCGEG
jgi:hypothetical protein